MEKARYKSGMLIKKAAGQQEWCYKPSTKKRGWRARRLHAYFGLGCAAGALMIAAARRMYYRRSIMAQRTGKKERRKKKSFKSKKRKKTQERNDKRNKRGGCWLLRGNAISRNPAVKRKKEKEKEGKKVNKKERKIERDTEIKKESFALLVLQYANLWT